MTPCKGCARRHNPLWRCDDPRSLAIPQDVTKALCNVTSTSNVTSEVKRNVTECAECTRLRAKLAAVERELERIKAGSAKRVKAYRERRAGK